MLVRIFVRSENHHKLFLAPSIPPICTLNLATLEFLPWRKLDMRILFTIVSSSKKKSYCINESVDGLLTRIEKEFLYCKMHVIYTSIFKRRDAKCLMESISCFYIISWVHHFVNVIYTRALSFEFGMKQFWDSPPLSTFPKAKQWMRLGYKYFPQFQHRTIAIFYFLIKQVSVIQLFKFSNLTVI